MKKTRDLVLELLIYVFSFIVGLIPCIFIKNVMLKTFLFDVVATLTVFVFSVVMKNSSVYDPYWSILPIIISTWLMVYYKAFSVWQIIFFIVFNLWAIRLTVNWIVVFSGFDSYEDWRYKKFREENKPFMWFIINFFGIHFVPTFVVFLGLLPLYVIFSSGISTLSIFGDLIILFGIAMEFFADSNMHDFLKKTTDKSVCKRGLWKYSRHPNYLGEMSVWMGVFFAMFFDNIDKWYYIIGMIGVIVLFNVVSVPLMEKRQLSRRPDYSEYKKHTSRVLLLPNKK